MKTKKKTTPKVYLIHFDVRLHHAGHYLGSALNLRNRMRQHFACRGARLLTVIREKGISYGLVRVWEGGRQLERQLKNRKNAPKLCPVCRGEEFEYPSWD